MQRKSYIVSPSSNQRNLVHLLGLNDVRGRLANAASKSPGGLSRRTIVWDLFVIGDFQRCTCCRGRGGEVETGEKRDD